MVDTATTMGYRNELVTFKDMPKVAIIKIHLFVTNSSLFELIALVVVLILTFAPMVELID
jgi:hypothetical protein